MPLLGPPRTISVESSNSARRVARRSNASHVLARSCLASPDPDIGQSYSNFGSPFAPPPDPRAHTPRFERKARPGSARSPLVFACALCLFGDFLQKNSAPKRPPPSTGPPALASSASEAQPIRAREEWHQGPEGLFTPALTLSLVRGCSQARLVRPEVVGFVGCGTALGFIRTSYVSSRTAFAQKEKGSSASPPCPRLRPVLASRSR